MKILKYIFLATIALVFTSCEDILEPELDGTLSEDAVWNNTRLAFGVLDKAYNNLPDGYNRISGAMLASATDDAVCSNPLSSIHSFNNGTWSPFNVVENVWNKNYIGIRTVNYFLENIDNLPLTKEPTALGTSESMYNTRERLKGEARFLRALFYFELVKRYGGVPLTYKALTPEEAANLPRSTSDECFEFIFKQCDSAATMLPRKYGAQPAIVGFNDAKDLGRATVGAAMALKSKASLYWASPLFNPTNDVSRWEQAAEVSNAVINLTLNANGTGAKLYSLPRFSSEINMSTLFSTNALLPLYNDEIIFSTKYYDNTTVERQNGPISFNAQGLTNPTQNLVDAFPMINGRDISDPLSGYDPANPYSNRDPRLAMTVLTNGRQLKLNDRISNIETFVGGTDGPEAYPNASQTGFYLQKFMMPQAVWEGRSVNVTRTWILFRLGEMFLNYAEARNEAFGPDADVLFSLRSIRFRAGISRAYVPTGLTQDQMRKFIQNERRIEMAFEEQRFFDVRRWKLLDNQTDRNAFLNIRGVKITKDTQGNLIYNPDKLIQTRVFNTNSMYLSPIPENELLKSKVLVQNPGW
jgi:hypothetical protein